MAKAELIKARELVATRWTQGEIYDESTKCYCLDGALGEAYGFLDYSNPGGVYIRLRENPNSVHDMQLISKAIADNYPQYSWVEGLPSDLFMFNDDGEHTKEDVLKVLDIAINNAE